MSNLIMHTYSKDELHCISSKPAKLIFQVFVLIFSQIVIFFLFHLASCFVTVNRPLFNVSYFIVPFVLLFSKRLAFLSSLILIFMDVFFSINLGGLSGPAMFGFLKLVPESGVYGYSMLSIFVLFFLILNCVLYFSFRKTNIISSVFAFILIAGVSFIYKAYSSESLTTLSLPGFLIKRSLGFESNAFIDARLFSFDVEFKPIIGGSFLNKNLAHKKTKAISIVIESLGVSKNKDIRDYIENKFRQQLGDRIASYTTSTSKGSTINGEIRELCSMETNSLVIASIPVNVKCIPYLLNRDSIYSAAYHNNNGDFYDRILWYKDAGFNDFYDKRKLISMGYTQSNFALSGISDKDMTNIIIQQTKLHDTYFMHWITMDTHGPYSILPDETLAPFKCSYLNINNGLVCNYMALVNNTIDSVINMAKMLPDADIFISGDHEPHFQDVANPRLIKDASDEFYMNKVLSIYIRHK